MWLELLKVIILGIIEGLTEWLPVSSTGHLILADQFLRLKNPVFAEVFMVVVQLAAILAVLAIFIKKLNPFRHKIKSPKFNKIKKLWLKILIACVPAGVVGVLFDDIIDQHLFNPIVVAVALVVYGVAFLIVERRKWRPRVKTVDQISYADAFKIGGFQMLALVPGTSRSGATILGGLITGVDRTVITEFSFFLALPVMMGASLLKFIKLGFQFTVSEWGLLAVGGIVSFVVSLLVINSLLNYVKKHDFKVFGWYRIGLGCLILLLYFFKILS